MTPGPGGPRDVGQEGLLAVPTRSGQVDRLAGPRRIGRYEQAESDLLPAKHPATSQYELSDVQYNLASVHALAGRTADALEHSADGELHAIGGVLPHVNDYFRNLSNVPEFWEIVGQRPER